MFVFCRGLKISLANSTRDVRGPELKRPLLASQKTKLSGNAGKGKRHGFGKMLAKPFLKTVKMDQKRLKIDQK